MTKREEKEKFPEWYKDGHEVLGEENSHIVDRLFKLYEKDKYAARVLYMNQPNGYENAKIMLFTKKNGEFSIVLFVRKFGVSISNRIYSREKRLMTLTFNGKFWFVLNNRGKKVGQATLANILFSIPHYIINNKLASLIIFEKLTERYSWLRFLEEHKVLYNTSFNTIIKHKLFSLKKALQYEYKVPLPVAKLLKKYNNDLYFINEFKYYLKYIDNVESLKEEWLSNGTNLHFFHDTLKMCKTLDKRINCSWSTRRLKEEHDKYSKILTDIIFTSEDRPMKIDSMFTQFHEFSGYKILTTTKEMAYEGKKQSHCVATYVKHVENGKSGIYSVNNYTLELIWVYCNGDRILKIGQFRGYNNVDAPEELKTKALNTVIEFNNKVLGVKVSKEQLLELKDDAHRLQIDWDELPF